MAASFCIVVLIIDSGGKPDDLGSDLVLLCTSIYCVPAKTKNVARNNRTRNGEFKDTSMLEGQKRLQ